MIEKVIELKKKHKKETIIWETKSKSIELFMSKLKEKFEDGEIDPNDYIENCKKIKNEHLKYLNKIDEIALKYKLSINCKKNVIERIKNRLIYYDEEINQEIPPKESENDQKDENKDDENVKINEKEKNKEDKMIEDDIIINKSSKENNKTNELLKVSSIELEFFDNLKFPKEKDFYPFNFESKILL